MDTSINTIAFSGRPDLLRLHELRADLDTAVLTGQSHVLVDLTGVEALTAAIVGLLLGAGRQLGRMGRRLAVVSPNPHFDRIFRMSGVALSLEVYASRDDALVALRD